MSWLYQRTSGAIFGISVFQVQCEAFFLGGEREFVYVTVGRTVYGYQWVRTRLEPFLLPLS